jgi:TM2 domain-containing membrane protein YozV
MEVDQNWVEQLRHQRESSDKNWSVALVLSIFFGIFGADRLYLGRTELGILKLVTVGGMAFW